MPIAEAIIFRDESQHPDANIGEQMSAMGLSPKLSLLLIVGTAALLCGGPALAGENSNEAGMLLQQCKAMLSGHAEVTARMSCENTIWSTLRTIEQIKLENPGMKIAYCAPGEITVQQGATHYVAYVSTHPETTHMPAERALIMALEATYRCP